MYLQQYCALGEIVTIHADLIGSTVIGQDCFIYDKILPDPYVGMPVVAKMQAHNDKNEFVHAILETVVTNVYQVQLSMFLDVESVFHKGHCFYTTVTWCDWFKGERNVYGSIDCLPASMVCDEFLRRTPLRKAIDQHRISLDARREQTCGPDSRHLQPITKMNGLPPQP